LAACPRHHGTADYTGMKPLLCIVVSVGLLACGGDGAVPLAPADPDQPPLDTANRTEPDRTWDGRVTAQDISWSYIRAIPLRTSISVVGSFRLTLVNADLERAFGAAVILRFVALDGERHVAEIPIARVTIPADSLLNIRENFIIEVKDQHAANAIERMDLSLF
jgi:hypothetical protein